jgi:outer membrane protein assembly factor BamE (lipoprotein component of BamABCDE complex)
MNRRNHILAPIVATIVVVVCVIYLGQSPENSRITDANIQHIALGMTYTDVESILGPPGDFRTMPGALLESSIDCEMTVHNNDWEHDPKVGWYSDSTGAFLSFNSSGRVTTKCSGQAECHDLGVLGNLVWRAWNKVRPHIALCLLTLIAVMLTPVTIAFTVRFMSSEDRINQGSIQRIATGMNRAAVHAILGPPGDHRSSAPTSGSLPADNLLCVGRNVAENRSEVWSSDSASITVYFDGSGVVTGKAYQLQRESLSKLFWRTSLRLARWF